MWGCALWEWHCENAHPENGSVRMASWEWQRENAHPENGSVRMRETIILYTKFYSANSHCENGSVRMRIVRMSAWECASWEWQCENAHPENGSVRMAAWECASCHQKTWNKNFSIYIGCTIRHRIAMCSCRLPVCQHKHKHLGTPSPRTITPIKICVWLFTRQTLIIERVLKFSCLYNSWHHWQTKFKISYNHWQGVDILSHQALL